MRGCPVTSMQRAPRILAAFAFLVIAGVMRSETPLVAQTYPGAPGPYAVRVDSTVFITLSDGVRLAADLYVPSGVGQQVPAIVWRTPYDKNRFRDRDPQLRVLASHGYVVVAEDVRGRFESEGVFNVQADDAKDGYETIEWVADQPWSDGKVGMFGCSYSGEAQILAAPRHPPHLTAMIPRAAGAPARWLGGYNGGAFELALPFNWFRENASKVHLVPAAGIPDSLFRKALPYLQMTSHVEPTDYRALWRTLPLVGMVERSGAPPTDFDAFVSHPPPDPWWNRFGLPSDTMTYEVPALQVSSWYDYGVAQTLDLMNRMYRQASNDAGRQQYVVISPTTHCGSEAATERTMVGNRDVGDARFDYATLYLDWWDRWLRGNQEALDGWPTVRYYVMGRGEWRTADAWPIPGTDFTKYYFHSDGRANSRFGDGTLSTEMPSGDEPADRYVYDPDVPVPSVGGPLCCTGSPDWPAGAFDQSEVEARNDILVYTTAPLERGVEATGPLRAVLQVSSDARDTDFTMKLVDVYPDGRAFNVQEGILRARYREGLDRQVWMEPGGVYQVEIDLQVTSNYFPAGHRIRVEVSSSNFPRFDRNLNTGGKNWDETEWKVARNVIHHSAAHPSYLILPVIPDADGAAEPAGR